MSKYEPAREDGLKPYIVTVRTMGRESDQQVADNIERENPHG